MSDGPKIPLDYSSAAKEREREEDRERERRDALESYNESTFGERRPLRTTLLHWAVLVTALGVIGFGVTPFIGRVPGQLLMYMVVAAFLLLEYRRLK